MANSLGNILRYYRECMSLTQTQLASIINDNVASKNYSLNQSSINKIEKGGNIPMQTLSFLQHKYCFLDLDNAFAIFNLAKKISELYAPGENFSLERLFKLRTKKELITLIKECCKFQKDSNDLLDYVGSHDLEDILELYPENIYISISYKDKLLSLKDIWSKARKDINSLATLVFYLAFNYLISKSNKMMVDKTPETKDYLFSMDKMNELMSDNDFSEQALLIMNVTNWQDCNDAAKGKYLMSLNKKLCIIKCLEESFQSCSYFYDVLSYDAIDIDPSIPKEKKNSFKDALSLYRDDEEKSQSLTIEQQKELLKFASDCMNNIFLNLFGIYNYYQNLYIPNISDFDLLINTFIDNNWFNDLDFINSENLQKEVMHIYSSAVQLTHGGKLEELLQNKLLYDNLTALFKKLSDIKRYTN